MKKKLLLTLTMVGALFIVGCSKKTSKKNASTTEKTTSVTTNKTTRTTGTKSNTKTTKKATTTENKLPAVVYDFGDLIKYELEYDSKGNITKRTGYAKKDDSYVKHSETLTTYNNDGTKASLINYIFDKGELVFAEKEEYTYIDNNNKREEKYDYDYENNVFENDYYMYSNDKFDASGNLIEEVYFEDGWLYEQKDTYTYIDGKVSKIEKYDGTSDDNWILEYRYEYTYTENTKREDWYIIDHDNNTEELRRYIIYYYDASGKMTKEECYGHTGGENYILVYECAYTYDSNGKTTRIESGMYGDYKYVYIDDSYGDRYTFGTYSWNGTEWVEEDLT